MNVLATDTPLVGRPALQLAAFGFATGFAAAAGWVLRVAWRVRRCPCGQVHR